MFKSKSAMGFRICFILSMFVSASSTPLAFKYSDLGCWADNMTQRSVPSQEHDSLLGGSVFKNRTNAIQKCAQVAAKNEFKVFVLQNGGWCGGSAKAISTYRKYGASKGCNSNGTGGHLANNVYKLNPILNPWYLHNNFYYATSWIREEHKVAKAFCEFYGGTLAMLTTSYARNILQTLGSTNTDRFWIAVTNHSTVGSDNQWQGNRPLKMSQMRRARTESRKLSKTHGRCVIFDNKGQWYAPRDCTRKEKFLCQKPAGALKEVTGKSRVGSHINHFRLKKRIAVLFNACYAKKPVKVRVVVTSSPNRSETFRALLVGTYSWGFIFDVIRTDKLTGWRQRGVYANWTAFFSSKKINVNPCGMKRNCKNVLGGHICSFPRRILTDKGLAFHQRTIPAANATNEIATGATSKMSSTELHSMKASKSPTTETTTKNARGTATTATRKIINSNVVTTTSVFAPLKPTTKAKTTTTAETTKATETTGSIAPAASAALEKSTVHQPATAGGRATKANGTGATRKISTTESATVATNAPITKITSEGNPIKAKRKMSTESGVSTTSAIVPTQPTTKANSNRTATGKATETKATTIMASRKTVLAKRTKSTASAFAAARAGIAASEKSTIHQPIKTEVNVTKENATGGKRKSSTTETATEKASKAPTTRTTIKGNRITATRKMSTENLVHSPSAVTHTQPTTKAKTNRTAMGEGTETKATTIRASRKAAMAKRTKSAASAFAAARAGIPTSEKSSRIFLFHNRSSTDQAGGNATTANATGTKRKITTTESATVKASNGPRTKTTTKGNPTTATRTMSTTDVTTTSAMAPAYRATKAKANTTTAVGKTTETAATTIRANRKTTKAKATKTGSAISLSAFEGSEKSIYCDSSSIVVPSRNFTYTFLKTNLGMTVESIQKCKNGNPMASTECVLLSSQISIAQFKTPHIIDCNTNLTATISKINVSDATTASVCKTMAVLKLLTSNSNSMNSSSRSAVVNILTAIAETNEKVVKITLGTLNDALVTINHVTTSFEQNSNSTPFSEARQKQKLIEAFNALADRVILPARSSSVKLVTSQITLQVTEPYQANGKYESVEFDKSGTDTARQAFAAMVPGALFDEAKKAGQLRRKRAASNDETPMRVSIALHNSSTLFPAKENAPVVISVHLRGHQPNSTTNGIDLYFTHINAKQGRVPFNNGSLKETVTKTQCSVYVNSKGQWVTNGCALVAGSSPPRCTCFKFASFSMIVSTAVLPSAFTLGIVSYVGCSLSIIGLVITIWVYTAVWELRRRQPTTFLLNICFNLLLANLVFVLGAGQTSETNICYLVTALMHFFLLAAWFWMSANAYNMCRALTDMVSIGERKILIPTVVCYGIPSVIVLVNSTVTVFHVDKHHNTPGDPFFQSAYRSRSMCWLHEESLHFGFLLPVGVLALFNVVCFIAIMNKICCRKKVVRSTAQNRSKKEDVFIGLSICVVMGLAWVFGFLMMVSEEITYKTAMSWLFNLFNSTQGLFIFLMNCVRQKKVRDMWWKPLVTCVTCKQNKVRSRENSTAFTERMSFMASKETE